MDIESVRKFCLSLPHVTEGIQWENDLLLRIGNKMFVVISLEPASDHCMSFKCTPEKFAELIEQEGIMRAPYVGRYHWVALERFDVLPAAELKGLLTTAYELVRDKLPKKVREGLTSNLPETAEKKAKRRGR
jgi:predicted DNA-binding protein (MmcQ/YjbR family)